MECRPRCETRGILSQQRCWNRGADKIAVDAQAGPCRGLGHDANKRLMARLPVEEQQLIASHLLELGALGGCDAKCSLREASTQIGSRCRRNHYFVTGPLPLCSPRCTPI